MNILPFFLFSVVTVLTVLVGVGFAEISSLPETEVIDGDISKKLTIGTGTGIGTGAGTGTGNNSISESENFDGTTNTTAETHPVVAKTPLTQNTSRPVPVPVPVSPNGTLAVKDKIRERSDLTDDLLDWEAPPWFRENVPYYQSGHDDDGLPVWIAEMGKFPLKELGEMDEDGYAIFDKYIGQASLRIIKSIEAQNTEDREVTEAFFVLDFDGFNTAKLASTTSILLVVRIFRAYSDLLIHYMNGCIAVNVNYVAQLAINVARPVLGRALEKLEAYGTSSAKWKNVLRQRLPTSALPPWYGGDEDFKPLKIYG